MARREAEMGRSGAWEYEFLAVLPRNQAEVQAALDAASDPEWVKEARRVRGKIVRRLPGATTGQSIS